MFGQLTSDARSRQDPDGSSGNAPIPTGATQAWTYERATAELFQLHDVFKERTSAKIGDLALDEPSQFTIPLRSSAERAGCLPLACYKLPELLSLE